MPGSRAGALTLGDRGEGWLRAEQDAGGGIWKGVQWRRGLEGCCHKKGTGR